MDPMTALSLAGTIVQFVDFGTKLLKDGRELYKSGSGALTVNEELELTTNDLRALITKVRLGLSTVPALGPLTEEETEDNYSFKKICDEAAKISENIIERLDKLKIKNTEHRKWTSLKHAVRSGWEQRELADLIKRLSNFREALHGRILYSIRYVSRGVVMLIADLCSGNLWMSSSCGLVLDSIVSINRHNK
jgi:hypothetical protein